MPNTFTRHSVTEICEAHKIKISTRTIDRMLERLVENGVLRKIIHGTYEKSIQ
jgi:DNA-binding HxlR family transcriptional regulator